MQLECSSSSCSNCSRIIERIFVHREITFFQSFVNRVRVCCSVCLFSPKSKKRGRQRTLAQYNKGACVRRVLSLRVQPFSNATRQSMVFFCIYLNAIV